MKKDVLNKIVLAAGALVLIVVLLNPPVVEWTTVDLYSGPIPHHETKYSQWFGEIFAVVVATAIGWYLTRNETGEIAAK